MQSFKVLMLFLAVIAFIVGVPPVLGVFFVPVATGILVFGLSCWALAIACAVTALLRR